MYVFLIKLSKICFYYLVKHDLYLANCIWLIWFPSSNCGLWTKHENFIKLTLVLDLTQVLL